MYRKKHLLMMIISYLEDYYEDMSIDIALNETDDYDMLEGTEATVTTSMFTGTSTPTLLAESLR